MKKVFSSKTIKNSMSTHSWIGLWSAAIIYLVCLSGSLAVLFEEFDRWEQPLVSEYHYFDPTHIEPAMQEYTNRLDNIPPAIYVVLPTEDFPRTHITDGIDEWYLSEDGKFEDRPDVPWTSMLKHLHTQLHLPHLVGMSIVGLSGVLILVLIISGIVAHPTIIRDAFKLRIGRSERQTQTDLHNRLGVWGIPFHLMISFTGAFIGLSSLLMGLGAYLYFDNNETALIDTIYGGDPVMKDQTGTINYPQAFNNLKEYAPDSTPIYLAVHHYRADNQLLEIAATLPGRYTYSEIYRFNKEGEVINHQGLSDGPVGQQIAYSTYRIHFGHYAGIGVKIIYVLMGLALTYIAVSGVNIWLARQKEISNAHVLWRAWIWATPIGLLVAWLGTLIKLDPTIVYWSSVVAILAIASILTDKLYTRPIYQYITLILLICVLGLDLVSKSNPFYFPTLVIYSLISLSIATMIYLLKSSGQRIS